MIQQRPLRLIVDPPYPGESTSSFLGRASQAYRVSFNTLLKQLSPGERIRQSLRDLDRWPSHALLAALAEAVAGWTGSEFSGPFPNRWCIASAHRTAYCPACFREDLEAGRTPYFRSEWMAVLSLFCRLHRSPLFDWEDTDGQSHRRLPLAWVDQSTGDQAVPDFFREHEARLASCALRPTQEIHPGGPPLEVAFSQLHGLQDLLEQFGHRDPSAFAASPGDRLWIEAAALARIAFSLVEEGQPLFRWGLGASDDRPSEWLGPGSLKGRIAKHHKVYARRRCAAVPWRRYYWLFVADRLARSAPEHADALRVAGDSDCSGTRVEIDLTRFHWVYEAESRGGLETDPA